MAALAIPNLEVAAHRADQTGGFGDGRYLSRHPQPAALPDIDRKHISRARARQVHRVLHGIHALIGHDRDIYVVPDVSHPSHIHGWNRLLGKVNAELAHSPDRLDCHSRRPASVSVYAQPHLWTNSLANGPHARHIAIRIDPYFHLHGRKSLANCPGGQFRCFIRL